jgi:hypothetical protein
MKTYYRTSMTRSKRDMQGRPLAPERPVAWGAATVWAAAAYAHRINDGEYRKENEYRIDENGHYTHEVVRGRNRDIMNQALRNEALITDTDRDLGRRAQDYVSKQILVKALKGTLSEFEQSLQGAVATTEFDEWTSRVELAIVASQIRSYEQAVQLEAAMEGIRSEPVADVGAKVDTEITVVKSVYSQNFGVYFITAVTADKQAVFFSYRERLANGHQCRVRGTVKAHRENSTQLNRVRIA